MSFKHATLHAATIALLAGSLASVAAAQDGKEVKDPKADGKAPDRMRDAKAAAATPRPVAGQPSKNPAPVQPTKTTPAPQPKAGTPGPSPAPAASAPPAPGGDQVPIPVSHNFPPPPNGWFRFDAFAEPVDVKLLVDMVADQLKIQIISTDTALRDKKIQLYTPIDVPEEKLLDFLNLLLEQNGQFIRRDPLGFYVIEPQTAAGSNIPAPGNDLATTQVIPTRGIKPSTLNLAIAQVLKGGPSGGSTPGQPPQPQASLPNIAYLDDLGVLVITDTPRRIAAVKGLIETISNEQINLTFTRFEVRHLSATIAKQRMLELLGQITRSTNAFGGLDQAQIQLQQQQANPDPQSNALTLRGHPEEVELISRMLQVVDVPNQLVPKWYPVGPAAQALAEQGKRSGMGDVIVMQSTRGTGSTQNPNVPGGSFFPDENGFPVANRLGQNNQTATGPVFVLDADQRGFIYYGTPEQHEQLERLVHEFGEITQAERVVYEFYKLKFVDATKVSDLIRGMINNTVPSGESPLVPGAGGGGGGGRARSIGAQQAAANAAAASGAGGETEIVATDQVHVLPDTSNNQVVVKAPQRLQQQFARLINKIDLRRPQVYIDAKIIVVTNREDFQLAVETQLVNAGGAGGALRTLFPGSPTPVPPGSITAPPTVNAATGIVAAVIKSDMVPIMITALGQSRAGRIVASPQLLVDDNEEATITSINQEPTTTTVAGTGGSAPITSFDQYVEAGPKLTVKPRLSTGDLLSMEYEVELSSFTSASVGSTGVPPPKIVNNIKSKSVTLPSDSTIVVGGLEFSQKTNTVFKVPFLGDIPFIGEAFKSTTTVDDKRTVYVFITPRIMRDPIGNDLRFISEGPARRAENENSLPPVKLEIIEINAAGAHAVPLPPDAPPASGGLGEENPTSPNVQPATPPANPPAPQQP